MSQRRKSQQGFTLIELLVVVTIIGILAGIAIVQQRHAIAKAQEAALRSDLHDLRSAIDNYYADKQHYPGDLKELVPRYLRAIPKDPITKHDDWQTITADQVQSTDSSGGQLEPTEAEKDQQQNDPNGGMSGPGIIDVKSNAKGKTEDGTAYSDL